MWVLEILFGLSTSLFAVFVGYHLGEGLSEVYNKMFGESISWKKMKRRLLRRLADEDEENEIEEGEGEEEKEKEGGDGGSGETIETQADHADGGEEGEELQGVVEGKRLKGKEKVNQQEKEEIVEEGGDEEEGMQEGEEEDKVSDAEQEYEREEVSPPVNPRPLQTLILYSMCSFIALVGIYLLLIFLTVFERDGLRVYVALMAAPPATIIRHYLIQLNLTRHANGTPWYTLCMYTPSPFISFFDLRSLISFFGITI